MINKFVPLSPDPYLNTDADMSLAKFGHINSIVDFLADSLKLATTGPLTATLTPIVDAYGNLTSLKLSINSAQFTSPLRITTDDISAMYLDIEDGSTNNRFNITRVPSSQQVNLNFASNPVGSTTIVGGIRTYVDGINLSDVVTFREDGLVNILKLGITSLPNSSAGLPSGSLWYDPAAGNAIKYVP